MIRQTDNRMNPCPVTLWKVILIGLIPLFIFGCGGKKDDTPSGAEAGIDDSTGTDAILAFGTVVASDQLEIHLPWDGRISEIPVWEGQSVVRGDILAVLDENDRNLALESARLTSESARARTEEASSRLGSLEVSVGEAAGRLERTRKLVDGGSVSAQTLSSLQAEYDALVYDRDASRWTLAVARGEAEKAEAEERRLSERIHGEHFELNRLICPFRYAVVAEVSRRPGAELEAGDLLMVLHDTESLIVEADLPEEFVRDISIGSPSEITPVADPERSYSGTVIEIAGLAVLENGENVVKTRISLKNRDGFLREGFNVDVEI